MPKQDRPTPQLYKDLFETDKRGRAIYDDLCLRFNHPPVVNGGIDAILQTYMNEGARMVLDHIILQINRANGEELKQTEGGGYDVQE